MRFRQPPAQASLIHLTVTTSHGGPHVGPDHSARVGKIAAPVPLAQGQARLSCEQAGCFAVYDLRLFSAAERWKSLLRRFVLFAAILAVGSLTAQSGRWVYDAGTNSQPLRILGDILTAGGVLLNLGLLLVSLMSFWFWPPRYSLDPVPDRDGAGVGPSHSRRRYSDTRTDHRVKLLT